MKRRPKFFYTEEHKAFMWDRWKKGDSLESIARLFDRHHPSIERIIRAHGGIRVLRVFLRKCTLRPHPTQAV